MSQLYSGENSVYWSWDPQRKRVSVENFRVEPRQRLGQVQDAVVADPGVRMGQAENGGHYRAPRGGSHYLIACRRDFLLCR